MVRKDNSAGSSADFTQTLTCQICGGKLACLEGFIARHGHRRIKGKNGEKGYMTPGCSGSRELPLENSREAIPAAIEGLGFDLRRAKEYLAWVRKDIAKEGLRWTGYVIGDIDINEEDLDRRDIDIEANGCSAEKAAQTLQLIREAMAWFGVGDFQYGTMNWNQFWSVVVKRAKQEALMIEGRIAALRDRYNNWVQTISDEAWMQNRVEIVGVKRTAATLEGWEIRDRPEPKAKPNRQATERPFEYTFAEIDEEVGLISYTLSYGEVFLDDISMFDYRVTARYPDGEKDEIAIADELSACLREIPERFAFRFLALMHNLPMPVTVKTIEETSSEDAARIAALEQTIAIKNAEIERRKRQYAVLLADMSANFDNYDQTPEFEEAA